MTPINPEFFWPYFTYNGITYNLRKGFFICLTRIQHITVLISFIFGDPWFVIIFLGILNRANQYLNLKPKLITLEILIADVLYVVRLIYTLNLYVVCSCYRTVPSAIWEIFSEFLIVCNLFHEPLAELNNSKI